jgi:hypothetical protein
MRRLRLSLLVLPFLLLLAQQGAFLHELSHAAYSAQHGGAQLSSDQRLPDDSHCPTCRSFGQLSNLACAADAGLTALMAAQLRVPDRVYSIIGAKAPTARSRGPPPANV